MDKIVKHRNEKLKKLIFETELVFEVVSNFIRYIFSYNYSYNFIMRGIT